MVDDDKNKDDNVKAQMRTRFEWLYGFTEKLTGAFRILFSLICGFMIAVIAYAFAVDYDRARDTLLGLFGHHMIMRAVLITVSVLLMIVIIFAWRQNWNHGIIMGTGLMIIIGFNMVLVFNNNLVMIPVMALWILMIVLMMMKHREPHRIDIE